MYVERRETGRQNEIVMKQQCPKCGNWVEGKKKETLARKTTKAVVKKGSSMVTGAAIGSIVPGLGTAIGGAIGLAAGLLLEDDVNHAADVTNDTLFGVPDYEFHCPKCQWTWSTDSNWVLSTQIQQKKPAQSNKNKNKNKNKNTFSNTSSAFSSNTSTSSFSEKDRAILFNEIKQCFGKPDLKIDCSINFLTLENNETIFRMQMFSRLQTWLSEKYGITIPMSKINNSCTFSTLIDVILKEVPNCIAKIESKQKYEQPKGVVKEDFSKGTSTLTVSASEREYLDELKACLDENSVISPQERRLLDRFREKLGVSAVRAKELEESLKKPQLTKDEQEYVEEYRACLNEGRISDKERRLLDKLRIMLGITEARAKELEIL